MSKTKEQAKRDKIIAAVCSYTITICAIILTSLVGFMMGYIAWGLI